MNEKCEIKTYDWESREAREKGLEVVETVRIGKHQVISESFLKIYAKQVEEIIKKTRATLIAIEYKEDSETYTKWAPAEYYNILKTAVDVAKDNRVKITNGGMEGDAALVYFFNHLLIKDREKYKRLVGLLDKNKQEFIISKEYDLERKEIIKNTETFLKIYKNTKINYLNIHWNETSPEILKECFEFFKDLTDLNVISTEFVKPHNKDLADSLMKQVNSMKIKCVIYFFALEGVDGETIINEEGKLTKLAKKVSNFIWWHYNKLPRITSKYSKTKQRNNDDDK